MRQVIHVQKLIKLQNNYKNVETTCEVVKQIHVTNLE